MTADIADPSDVPIFSIVIPTFNRSDMVRRAIESCLAQSFDSFEVIVADDGSSDETGAVVRSIEDRRVRYEWAENAGAAAARNRGARLARGQLLAFLDSDDIFLPDKLANVLREIEGSRDGADRTVWYSRFIFRRATGVDMIRPARAIDRGERVGDYLFADEGVMQTSTLVIPRTVFERVEFDPTLRSLQDLDLCLRLEAAGFYFQMLQEPQTVWYDDAADGRISQATKPEQIRHWAEVRRGLLSRRAHSGFLARYLAPRIIRSRPVEALGLISGALRWRSISAFRAAAIIARGTMPEGYARFRNKIVRMRTAPTAPHADFN